MEMKPYIVYIKTDDTNRITAVNSSAFLPDTTGWTEIDSGYGYKYHHAQGNYFPHPLYDERGVCRYKLVDGKPVERSAQEMDADYAVRPTQEMTDMELLLAMAADHEYRLCLMELGVSEDDI